MKRVALYDNVRQAYKHLETEDHPAYQERGEGDYVVLFFPKTCTVRLFKKLETVGNWYAWSAYKTSVFTEPKQLSIMFSKDKLNMFAENLEPGASLGDNATSLERANHLWYLMQKHGSLVDQERPQMNASSEDEDKYVIDLVSLKDPASQAVIEKFPRQCRVIAQELRDADKSSYTVNELESFARQLVVNNKIKTKQDPFRIVRYYAPELAKHGFMEYRTRRVASDDE